MRIRLLILAAFLAAAGFPLAAQQSLSEAKDGTYYLYGTIGRTLEVELTLIKKGKELVLCPIFWSTTKLPPSRRDITGCALSSLGRCAAGSPMIRSFH